MEKIPEVERDYNDLARAVELLKRDYRILRKAYSIKRYTRIICGKREKFEWCLANAIAKDTLGRVLTSFENIANIAYFKMDYLLVNVKFLSDADDEDCYASSIELEIWYCPHGIQENQLQIAKTHFYLPQIGIVANENEFKCTLIAAYERILNGKCKENEDGASWLVHLI